MKYLSGIYKITNLKNGKIYVGSAKNLYYRWRMHLFQLRKGRHHSKYFQRAYDKHGEENFKNETLFICSKEDLIFYEQRTLDFYDSCDPKKGYNICRTAGSSLGRKMSKEYIEKMRERLIGNKYTLGFHPSDETKKKMSERMKGNKYSIGKRNWLGLHHSEETKKKLSENAKNRSEEYRRKLSETHKKRYAEGKTTWLHPKQKFPSEETRKKMSKAQQRRRYPILNSHYI